MQGPSFTEKDCVVKKNFDCCAATNATGIKQNIEMRKIYDGRHLKRMN